MRVIVCGGRDYMDRTSAFGFLDTLNAKLGITEVIEGGAPGADTLAGDWADHRGIKRTTVKANWKEFRKAAGPIRNKAMLALSPGALVAFPGGKGTANMVKQALDAGLRVWAPANA
ncbi:MAG: DUF2493 domain-containing protein [Rhodanobacter sp.]